MFDSGANSSLNLFAVYLGGRAPKCNTELRDAAYFLLYDIERDDAEYILSTFRGIHDRSHVPAGGKSVAENVLEVYDELVGRSAK